MEKQVELISSLVNELKNETSYGGIERIAQITIQALLDLGLMAISVLKGRKPTKYSEIGFVLQDLGVISSDQAEKLRAMAGLRNILVHMYAGVDRKKVLEASKMLVKDAVEISNIILNEVKRRGIDPQEPVKGLDLRSVISKLRETLTGKVLLAYLFGGRSKGYELRGDYDIAVLMPRSHTLYDLGLVQAEVAEALGVDEEKVDILCLNSAPPELVLDALNGIPIVEDPVKRMELEVRALQELLDMEESLKKVNELLAKDPAYMNS